MALVVVAPEASAVVPPAVACEPRGVAGSGGCLLCFAGESDAGVRMPLQCPVATHTHYNLLGEEKGNLQKKFLEAKKKGRAIQLPSQAGR